MILTTGIDIISEEGRDNYFNVALQYLHVNMVYIYVYEFIHGNITIIQMEPRYGTVC